ncbi:hypothetical protein DSCA_36310 [Desulfosarcina alkanivorans]|uniref:histidine kinase n=1 Tax=Desulfosarcina alkanivorans TaxID=571177 RepID=A0A5K7YRT8_9BACT|nr:ATP-binding protein [Desulfosarcina alkanivorans]BBO69701.1 hypothetical protein DSCA_36310 [Desulfosarcina alkanivorans]
MGFPNSTSLKISSSENGGEGPIREKRGIFQRTFVLLLLFSLVIIGLYSLVLIVKGRDALLLSLESEARSVSASLSQVCGNAIVDEDYEFIVEHCLEVLRNSSGIHYIVVSRDRGFTLVHTSKQWEMHEHPDSEWRFEKGEMAEGYMVYSPLIGKEVYRFSYPLQYSSLQWGWLYIGLSLKPLHNQSESIYKLTALLGLFCLLAAILGSYFFARNLTVPILSLLKATLSVAEGDLSARASLKTSDELGMLANSFNIMTERLEKTTVSKDYMDNIIQSMSEGLIVLDAYGKIKLVNDAALKLFKCSIKELYDRDLFEDVIVDKDASSKKNWLEQIFKQKSIKNIERTIIIRGGDEIPILMSGSILKNNSGFMDGAICLLMDITHRKKIETSLQNAYEELKNTQAQLVQSGKLASIGELVAGVAHELNQPLMVIRSNAQITKHFIREWKGDVDSLNNLLEPIDRNTKRMMNIINHLRTFSRQSHATFQKVDVNEIIDNSFLIIGEQLRLRGINVLKRFGSNLPKILGDNNQLEQVVLNLIANARDAILSKADNELTPVQNRRTLDKAQSGRKKEGSRMPSYKGQIEVVTKVGVTTPMILKEKETNNGAGQRFIDILVRDNGTGLCDADVDRIFDPFFTTKEVGKGTGLGLSISYGIIKDHMGDIKVTQTDATGTSMRVRIPTAG